MSAREDFASKNAVLLRSDWIDVARAIGIVAVVYGHVAHGLVKTQLLADEPFTQLIDSVIYSFHMPLFFFLSGYFFVGSLQKQKLPTFLTKKSRSIAFPYLVWSLIYFAAEFAMGQFANQSLSEGIIETLINPHNHLWFLYTLFFLFLLNAPFLYYAGRHALSFLLIIWLLLYLLEAFIPMGLPFRTLEENGVFLIVGACYSKWCVSHTSTWRSRLSGVEGLRGASWVYVACLIVTAAVLEAVYHRVLGMDYEDRGVLSFGLALFMIFTVLEVSKLLAPVLPKFVSYIGNSTMSIYLMHVMFYTVARIVMQKMFGIESVFVHVLVGLFIGILGSLIAQEILNRTVFRSILAR